MANQYPLIGSFFFKKTQNGNLIGEFSNNQSDIISTESADRTDPSDFSDFVGVYNATWQQNGETFFRTLSISLKQNNLHRIYELRWVDSNRHPTFYGEGFLVENILIGHYRINNTQ